MAAAAGVWWRRHSAKQRRLAQLEAEGKGAGKPASLGGSEALAGKAGLPSAPPDSGAGLAAGGRWVVGTYLDGVKYI